MCRVGQEHSDLHGLTRPDGPLRAVRKKAYALRAAATRRLLCFRLGSLLSNDFFKKLLGGIARSGAARRRRVAAAYASRAAYAYAILAPVSPLLDVTIARMLLLL